MTKIEGIRAERNYGLDLLRIVSIFMVLILHLLLQGGLLHQVEQFKLKGEVIWFLENGCYCAVNVYAIISGYVGYKSKPKAKKLLSLWLEVFLYSALFGCVSFTYTTCVLNQPANFVELLKCFFPFVFNKYWYFSAYVILFALMPILNIGLQKISSAILRNTLVFILLSFCFIPNSTFKVGSGYSVIWLIILYLLGGYLAKANPFAKMRSWLCFLLYFASITINYFSRWIARYIGIDTNILITYESIFIVLAAVFLVLGFSRLKIPKKPARVIGFFAPMAFSVYIIHCSSFIWNYLLNNTMAQFQSKNIIVLVLIIFCFALLLYAICTAIDFCRIQLFKLLHIDSFLEWLVQTPKKIINKFYKKGSLKTTPFSDLMEENKQNNMSEK